MISNLSSNMENFELKLRLKELETLVTMQQKHIELLTSQLNKTDENLKLSIQTPSTTTKCVITQPRFNPQLKLFDTVKKNVDSMSDEKLENLLQAKSPSLPSITHLIKKALQGDSSLDQQLIKSSTNSMCEYLNDKGVLELESSISVFDQIFAITYERCTGVFDKLSKALESKDVIDESMNEKLSNVYNNLMLLHDFKTKQKVIREIAPLIK